MTTITITINENGGLQVSSSAPIPPVNIIGFLEIAKAGVLAGLMNQKAPAVLPASAAALKHLDGGKN